MTDPYAEGHALGVREGRRWLAEQKPTHDLLESADEIAERKGGSFQVRYEVGFAHGLRMVLVDGQRRAA